MNLPPDLASLLRSLLLDRAVGCLATLHEGRPFASMVPFAATTIGGRLRLVMHVSGLAAHTRDMRSSPNVCLMIMAQESAAVPAQALPRVSISGRAVFLAAEDPEHALLAAAYLGKFPDTAPLFEFADFSVVALEPESARLVAGFARAITITADTLTAAIGNGSIG